MALPTREQLGIQALALAGQSEQSILRLVQWYQARVSRTVAGIAFPPTFSFS